MLYDWLDQLKEGKKVNHDVFGEEYKIDFSKQNWKVAPTYHDKLSEYYESIKNSGKQISTQKKKEKKNLEARNLASRIN